jgi:hypothetical protein
MLNKLKIKRLLGKCARLQLLPEVAHVPKFLGELPEAGLAARVVFPAHGHFLNMESGGAGAGQYF